MADTIQGKRFYLPVYKSQTGLAFGDAGYGELIEAGDTLRVLLLSADGTKPLKDLTVISVNAEGTEVFWEYDAGNTYTTSDQIFAVDPRHQYTCPPVQNIGLVGISDLTTEVTAFVINGVSSGAVSFAVSLVGAAALELALNEALNGNGVATVVYVDAATDYLKVYVMGTTAVISVDGVDLDVLP